MKHLKFSQFQLILPVMFALTLFIRCKEAPKTTPEPDSIKQAMTEEATAPKEIITLEEATVLYETYTERRLPLIERFEIPTGESKPFVAARYTYFDYKTIKQYLAFIEQEAASANVDIATLRFYFGNYPVEGFSGTDTEKNARKNTIFIVPTMNRDGQDFGFYTREGTDGKREAVPIAEALGGNAQNQTGSIKDGQKQSYAGFALPALTYPYQGGQSLILNRGNSGPPPPQ